MNIGILYSTETGIILRTINPDSYMGDHYLDKVEAVKPEGTTLLRLDKTKIGADELNCPNLFFLIPYIQKNHNLNLGFGKRCGIVNSENEVIATAQACPVLHQKKLNKDAEIFNKNKHFSLAEAKPHTCVEHDEIEVGDTYDLITKKHTPKKLEK